MAAQQLACQDAYFRHGRFTHLLFFDHFWPSSVLLQLLMNNFFSCSSTFVCACRVLSYMDKWGHSNKALKAFEWMQLHSGDQHAFDTQDTFLYTRLITMFSRRASDCSEALRIFDSMQSRGIKPDLVAYNTAINAAGKPFSNAPWSLALLCMHPVHPLSCSFTLCFHLMHLRGFNTPCI